MPNLPQNYPKAQHMMTLNKIINHATEALLDTLEFEKRAAYSKIIAKLDAQTFACTDEQSKERIKKSCSIYRHKRKYNCGDSTSEITERSTKKRYRGQQVIEIPKNLGLHTSQTEQIINDNPKKVRFKLSNIPIKTI